jgi:SUKH superfamily protein
MTIKTLMDVFPPPDKPLDADGDWALAEAELSVRFPTDFRELIRAYGTGEFRLRGLVVSNPLTEAGRKEIREKLWILGELRDALEIPLKIYPERPGLVPWGGDSNGNFFCWWTDGEPDDWPVVRVGHEEEENPQAAEVNITTFLAGYAQNQFPEMQGGLSFDESHRRFVRGGPGERADL